ncbi:MAG: UDP-N-acetylmuramoyl-tripeptide--D-alanyl-D-alanine ligase, partial [Sciscionella sp.]
ESSPEAHEEIGRLAARLSIGRVVAVGADAVGIRDGANREGSPGEESVLVADVDAALELLRAELRPDDVVLLKASNAARLWRVADGLLDGIAVNSSGGARPAPGGVV